MTEIFYKEYGLIWDMDGVLIDTAEAHYQAWKDTLSKYGVDFSRKYFDDTFGINDYSLIVEVIHPKPAEDMIQEISLQKEKLYRTEIRKNLKVYSGVKEILGECQSYGFKQALDSSAPQENIDAAMEISGLRPYFDQIISTDGMPSKEFPDAYLAAATALNLAPDHCIVMEDSILGIKGAKKAGMTCIAIASTHPQNRLQQADWIVSSIEKLNIITFQTIMGIQEG
ncbi:MAG: HAD family hydrolase [Anaerolineaceae bacterium]